MSWNRQFKEAIKEYQRALKLRPYDIPIMLALAEVFVWTNNIKSAISQYKKVLEISPDNILANFHLGELYYQCSDLSKAKKRFEHILEINPKHDYAKAYLSKINDFLHPNIQVRSEGNFDNLPSTQLFNSLSGELYPDPDIETNITYRHLNVNQENFNEIESNEIQAGAVWALLPPILKLSVKGGCNYFNDGKLIPLYNLKIDYGKKNVLSLMLEHSDITETADAIEQHISSTSFSPNIKLNFFSNLLIQSNYCWKQYSDDNVRNSFSVWTTYPIWEKPKIQLGCAYSYDNTNKNYWTIKDINSKWTTWRYDSSRDTAIGTYTYEYDGEYSPYWTPVQFQENR